MSDILDCMTYDLNDRIYTTAMIHGDNFMIPKNDAGSKYKLTEVYHFAEIRSNRYFGLNNQ